MSRESREAALRGRIGGFAKAARHDPYEYTQAARAGFARRFAVEVDPNGDLSIEERLRRANAARKSLYGRSRPQKCSPPSGAKGKGQGRSGAGDPTMEAPER
jgi:hypothetical protein